MKNNRFFILLLCLLQASFLLSAQDFKKDYEKAEALFNTNQYDQALPLFLTLHQTQVDNNNINFQVGVCYINAPTHQELAIPYLLTASNDISEKYNPGNYKETHAPADAYLYLAKACHLSYRFDSAIGYFNKFLGMIDTASDKQQTASIRRSIQMCNTGKELVAHPVKMTVANLGSNINSPYPDYSPVVTADEAQIFFTSRREGEKDETGKFFEQIYMANMKGSSWDKAFNIGPPVNQPRMHSATVGISPDGQTIYIYRDENGGDIFTTHLNGTQWSTPEKLDENVDSKYWEPSASVSADGQTLYFTSNRPGGFGGRDIYMSRLLPNGQWGKAMNLGPNINTQYEEDAPFISANDSTLYFSSTGHNTMGGFDVFSSARDSNGHWSAPVNMGYPVNSPGDDIFFFPTSDGKGAYYSSFKDNGEGETDIYRITFPEKKAEAITVYRGIIKSAVDSTVPQNISITVTDNETGEIIGTYVPNSATGRYLIILPSGKNYNITYSAEDYLFESENIDVRFNTAYSIIDKAVDLNPLRVGEKIILKNIFFASGSTQLSPESKAELSHLYDIMTRYKGMNVEISGYTDAQGSDQMNMKLSYERAKAVVNSLIKLGIDSTRLVAKGYGPQFPIAKNKNTDGSWNPAGMKLNRRIEFKILSSSIPLKLEQPKNTVPDNLKPDGKN